VQSAQQVANAKIVLVRKRVVTAPVPSSISGVTSRNKCDVLKMTVTKGRKAANSTASCRVTLAVTNFCFRPRADLPSASTIRKRKAKIHDYAPRIRDAANPASCRRRRGGCSRLRRTGIRPVYRSDWSEACTNDGRFRRADIGWQSQCRL
jgi:hypothetical protein